MLGMHVDVRWCGCAGRSVGSADWSRSPRLRLWQWVEYGMCGRGGSTLRIEEEARVVDAKAKLYLPPLATPPVVA